ncbi:deferrochelatase/peroxidase EfeB [Ursidibacter maritimus]|uniref:Deferrochelatase n=1 Tax=Ursidibacter maritimus TaxID=1331689 RepID=A0A949WFF8_9PAST|nr:iron uptake transporter deferrochelatase/peroxidase subunit [Ursidibacter maritimus]KAE9539244.1 peroxidase [Ursidibacter maritimus]MBV6524600.1 deferrochelatase/peroxidase EfeB [Ursidibacter maritimus]MBV6525425.1 deferrochelatase/peroxidase EfeB [Ursidibacter maritimus]MBV6526895.1 deferrochelatase/peroxidase EfeB [Ursidibacter maritimus]MBV6530276.1 deferrochelatase/peroxidase EfeB [Ursidibacter maritimus]
MSDQHSQNARRDFLKQATLISASLMAGTTYALEPRVPSQIKNLYPFFGTHQQGIASPAQKQIYFMVLDLHTHDIKEIKDMFKTWTEYSANLTSGKNVKNYGSNAYVPTIDTGEADGLNPHNLTLTFGISPTFFEKLGITKLKPKALNTLPHFPRDQLKEHYSGGDICIQACADDPQIAFHAVRNLVRVARSKITMRWSQSGFNSFENGDTPRNLFGFKDGTGNPQGEALNETVWCSENDWLKNGSYLVARRIQMHLETWDRTNLNGQEETFGRHRDSGAPLGEKKEFDAVDLEKKDEKGNVVIPEISHLHLAKKTGLKILRRSFSYASGVDPKTGQFDAGLLFISFQKDPAQFITIQNSLGNIDKMNEYITHIGSGLFACFAGVKDENDYLGKALFDQI